MKNIDNAIYNLLRSPDFMERSHEISKGDALEFPVTMTYALERLVITHVKLFMMEDQVRDESLSDEEVGKIKRKIDYWNGVVRPRLIASLGDMTAEAILGQNADIIKEPDLKDYKAR